MSRTAAGLMTLILILSMTAHAELYPPRPYYNILRAYWLGGMDGVNQLLAEDGQILTGKHWNGYTLLHHAARYDDILMVRILLEAGADKTVPNDDGDTPYDTGRWAGSTRVLDLLRIYPPGARQLEELSIGNTPVNDTGLRALEGLPQLRVVLAPKLEVAEKGTDSLSRLERLVCLDLSHTRPTDENLASLKDAGALRFLGLAHTGVSEKAIIPLTTVPLEVLDLRGMTLSAAGIDSLGLMKSLKRLILAEGEAEKGVASRLRQLLPGCTVEQRGPGFRWRDVPEVRRYARGFSESDSEEGS